MGDTALLLKTPLRDTHFASGAKMVEFSGWEMPLQFSKVLEEHHAVREACGLFDISHMGILSVTSSSVEITCEALNALVPQDLTKLYPGKAFYTQLLNPEGGIIDDIIVYDMPPVEHFPELSQFMVICNAGNAQKVISWLGKHLPSNVTVTYLNHHYSLLALQGPQFEAVLNAVGLEPAGPLPKRFHLGEFFLADMPVLLSRTGYTGEDGVEILVSAAGVVQLWQTLLQQGAANGIKPIGLAARDTLRLEAAYPLHGSDITEATTPLEAGLGWSVKLNQEADFIGKSALLAQQSEGLKRHFICFEVLKKSIPRPHDLLYDKEGQAIGEVTSGSISPTLNIPIGVGYVQHAISPGEPVWVERN